jgi:hypothetical protein
VSLILGLGPRLAQDKGNMLGMLNQSIIWHKHTPINARKCNGSILTFASKFPLLGNLVWDLGTFVCISTINIWGDKTLFKLGPN